MRISFVFYALFCARPRTLLTITAQQATLASIATPAKPYATLTPIPYLLDGEHHITGPFQLRTFIDTHLPATARKPFSIVVVLPSMETEAALRLATQIAAVLLQLRLPAYVITHDGSAEIPAHKKNCIFFKKPTGNSPAWKTFAGAVICAAIAAAWLWLAGPALQLPQLPLPVTTEIKSDTPIKPQRPTITTPLHQPILATLYAHRPWCHFSKLTGSPQKTEAQFFCQDPAWLAATKRLLETATHREWEMKSPKYRAGYPPLYYGRILEAAPAKAFLV